MEFSVRLHSILRFAYGISIRYTADLDLLMEFSVRYTADLDLPMESQSAIWQTWICLWDSKVAT